MMTKNDEDYFFYIIWKDDENNKYRIGVLAEIEKMFYLRMHRKGQSVSVDSENKETAYDNGCIGITAFERNKIYRSHELFDFFKKRLLDKDSANPCEELREKGAVSMVDSFSVEEMEEERRGKCKEIILEMFELQEKNKQEENDKKSNLDGGHNEI